MGDRYNWDTPCPNCGETIAVYYAESSEITDIQCQYCKEEFDIVMALELTPKKAKK